MNENCDIKICDFGLARSSERQMTGYISTRFYRAPEIMLTWQKYDKSVDVWSVGCIFAEMLKGVVLFPGKDRKCLSFNREKFKPFVLLDIEQYDMITTLLGSPPATVINRICSENTKRYTESLPKRDPIDLRKVFKECDPLGNIQKLF